jgi:polyhydroxyalkanoate synthesis regulator phasin
MTDNNNVNNEQQRMYTEEEVFQLFQRFRNEEKAVNQHVREGRPLPLDISAYLEESTQQQLQDNFKRYKRDLSKYHHEEWTVGEEINKSLIPKLKYYTVDTAQVVSTIYKGSDIIRTHGRAATEIYEQLNTIREGEISQEEARQLLDETMESAKRLAIFAWAQARHQDVEAKDYAIKALKLPASLKHLEAKESGKRDAFSLEVLEQYNEANYQQRILRAATSNNSHGGRGGYSQQWNQHRGGRGYSRGGKNFFWGRGRGTPTFHSNYSTHSNHQQCPTQHPGNTEQNQ